MEIIQRCLHFSSMQRIFIALISLSLNKKQIKSSRKLNNALPSLKMKLSDLKDCQSNGAMVATENIALNRGVGNFFCQTLGN